MRLSLASIICAVSLLSAPALAQSPGFEGQRFAPAAGAAGGFTVERPYVPQHLDWSVGLFLNYGNDPVVLRDGATGAVLSIPLQSALTFDLLASVALFNRLELAVDLPLDAAYQGAPFVLDGQTVQARAGVGDLRFMPKVALLRDPRSAVALSLAVPFTLPTGNSAELRGDGVVTVNPELLFGLRRDRFGLNLSGGFRVRPGSAVLGHEVTLGAGALVALLPHKDVLDLDIETTAGALLGPAVPSISRVPWEALVGVTIKPTPQWQIYLGFGPGILDGIGAPQFRLVTGVRYSPRPTSSYSDRDNDGVADTVDRCPNEPEDYNGYEDRDGCPDRHRGRPEHAHERGHEHEHDHEHEHEHDRDRGRGHGAQDEHTLDRDHDGVPDDVDECPDEPEPRHPGVRDGCPEGEATYRNGEIVIRGKVQFESNSTTLRPKSERLLDSVAVLLKDHPEVKHVRIEGHTDETGPSWTNQQLSEHRAEVVRAALIRRGVAAGRMTDKGYGETRPIAPNDTQAGRAKNRRVEFKVVR